MRKVCRSSQALMLLLIGFQSGSARGEEADLAESTLALNRAAIEQLSNIEYEFTIQGDVKSGPSGVVESYTKKGAIKLSPERLFVWWDERIPGRIVESDGTVSSKASKLDVTARQYFLKNDSSLTYWMDHVANPVSFDLYPNGDLSERAFSQVSASLLDTVFVVIGADRMGLFEGYIGAPYLRTMPKSNYSWTAVRLKDSRIELTKQSAQFQKRIIVNPKKGGLVEESETIVGGKVAERTRAELAQIDGTHWFPRETLKESVEKDGSIGLKVRTTVHKVSIKNVKDSDFQLSVIPWKGGIELTRYQIDGRKERNRYVGGAWMPSETFNKLPIEAKKKAIEPLGIVLPSSGGLAASTTRKSELGNKTDNESATVTIPHSPQWPKIIVFTLLGISIVSAILVFVRSHANNRDTA